MGFYGAAAFRDTIVHFSFALTAIIGSDIHGKGVVIFQQSTLAGSVYSKDTLFAFSCLGLHAHPISIVSIQGILSTFIQH